MSLEYDNIFKVTSKTADEASDAQKRSDIMVTIHDVLDVKTTTIKNIVNILGITPAQARNLAKGNIDYFTIFELSTFLDRLK